MKNTQKNEIIFKLPDEVMETCQFTEVNELGIKSTEGVCVIHKGKMTVLELANTIAALGELASDMTVCLAKACGFCNNCKAHVTSAEVTRQATPAVRLTGGTSSPVCPFQPPAGFSCENLIALSPLGEQVGHVGRTESSPARRTVSEANNAIFAKIACALDAYADEDSGEITIVEADIQQDISDVPPGILSVLVASGVCLVELDELIMLEEIVYGA